MKPNGREFAKRRRGKCVSRPFWKASTILLLLDFQHGLTEQIGGPTVLQAAARAAESARTAGIPVMWIAAL